MDAFESFIPLVAVGTVWLELRGPRCFAVGWLSDAFHRSSQDFVNSVSIQRYRSAALLVLLGFVQASAVRAKHIKAGGAWR